MAVLEKYFNEFRKNIIGVDASFKTPFGEKPLIYADWIATGRLYRPIENHLSEIIGPWIGNTHTESSETGTLMTKAYHQAQSMIKNHVNANEHDIIITAGSGMTTVINKLQRMLGLRNCTWLQNKTCQKDSDRPVVFITHMEHHSNHTSWFETVADVVVMNPDNNLLIDIEELYRLLEQYKERKLKIGAFTACSNVTGIITPYYELAKAMHEYGGYCFIDFAASAPYVDINMHPNDPLEKLDAVMFSPHKFLGGPGASGVLVFDSRIYDCPIPDQPGGGTVDWTNPWGEYKYIDDIESREDGGTPGFMQAIKAALAIDLKNKMSVHAICNREKALVNKVMKSLKSIKGVNVLAYNTEERLGAISFYIDGLHYNLLVRLLNDIYGIQVRGGCACAGTYGHYLLDVSYEKSKSITEKILHGDLSEKPGWVRLSIHPTMTNDEIDIIISAIDDISSSWKKLQKLYKYDKRKNEFFHIYENDRHTQKIKSWLNPEYDMF